VKENAKTGAMPFGYIPLDVFTVKKETTECIALYPKGTAIIRYSLAGEIKDWPIGATSKDDEQSLRQHLKKWMPEAVFVGWEIKA